MMTDSTRMRVQSVLVQLVRPLSDEEVACGWTNDAKLAMRAYLEKVLRGEMPLRDLKAAALARAADHWGVESGQLLIDLAGVSNRIRDDVANAS